MSLHVRDGNEASPLTVQVHTSSENCIYPRIAKAEIRRGRLQCRTGEEIPRNERSLMGLSFCLQPLGVSYIVGVPAIIFLIERLAFPNY